MAPLDVGVHTRSLPIDHPLNRFGTTPARRSLADRLGLPYDDEMQDWEYEVAEPELCDESLRAYRSGGVDDDERFSLGEMLVQCVATMAYDQDDLTDEWEDVADLLRADPWTHATTISYWCAFETPHEWRAVGAAMRRLWGDVGPSLLEYGSA